MKLPLSNRLYACCSFVQPGDRVADVGCDHGYLGIYLLKKGIARSIIASDINEHPLDSARMNAAKFGVADCMTFHLSSGVRHIPHNFDTLVCAGMGADTIMSILSDAPWLRDPKYRLILQCQSKRPELRRYLSQHGYAIRRETLAKDGKFCYPVMEVIYEPSAAPLSDGECYLTPALRNSGSPLLPEFLDHVISGMQKAVLGLAHDGDEKYGGMHAILNQLQGWRETI